MSTTQEVARQLAELREEVANLRRAAAPQPTYPVDIPPSATAAIEFGRVRPPDYGDTYTDETHILAQLAKTTGSPWTGDMVDDGDEPVPVRVWPGTLARHYQLAIRAPAMYLPILTHADGNRYALLWYPIQTLYTRNGMPQQAAVFPFNANHPDA